MDEPELNHLLAAPVPGRLLQGGAAVAVSLLLLLLAGNAFAFSDADADHRIAAKDERERQARQMTMDAPMTTGAPWAPVDCLAAVVPAGLAQTRLVDMPAVERSRSISRAAICCSGSTSSAAPALMASRGMPKTTQVASSCTRL